MPEFVRAVTRVNAPSCHLWVRDLPAHIEAPASGELRGRDHNPKEAVMSGTYHVGGAC